LLSSISVRAAFFPHLDIAEHGNLWLIRNVYSNVVKAEISGRVAGNINNADTEVGVGEVVECPCAAPSIA